MAGRRPRAGHLDRAGRRIGRGGERGGRRAGGGGPPRPSRRAAGAVGPDHIAAVESRGAAGLASPTRRGSTPPRSRASPARSAAQRGTRPAAPPGAPAPRPGCGAPSSVWSSATMSAEVRGPGAGSLRPSLERTTSQVTGERRWRPLRRSSGSHRVPRDSAGEHGRAAAGRVERPASRLVGPGGRVPSNLTVRPSDRHTSGRIANQGDQSTKIRHRCHPGRHPQRAHSEG